jgi:hypothetical protein
MQAAKVLDAVRKELLRPERVAEDLEDLGPEGRRLLLWIYASEERGLTEEELMEAHPGTTSEARHLFAKSAYDLLALCRDGETRSYHGFKELHPLLLPPLLAEFVPAAPLPEKVVWVSLREYAASHAAHFLARCASGQVKATQAGELHRKHITEMGKRFQKGDALAASVGEEEVGFWFRFSAESGLLAHRDGDITLTDAAHTLLEKSSEELLEAARTHWHSRKAHGLRRTLATMAADGEPRSVSGLAVLLHGMAKGQKSKVDKQGLSTWENLPALLRDAFLVGACEFGMSKGRVAVIRFLPENWTPPESEGSLSPMGLPNLEALIPIHAPLLRLFQTELCALRENDEKLVRYRFTKESVVRGLQAGLSQESLGGLAEWVGFDPAARRILQEWASLFASTRFRELLVLQVKDPARLAELQDFPEFMRCVSETLPGYGFVVPAHQRRTVRELLEHFGLCPGDEKADPEPALPLVIESQDKETTFVIGDPVYRETEPVFMDLPDLPEEGQGRPRPLESEAERVNLLERAIFQGQQVEFVYAPEPIPTAPRLRLKPLHLLRHKSPMKLIGVDSASGHRNEYLIDQVQFLKVVEQGIKAKSFDE